MFRFPIVPIVSAIVCFAAPEPVSIPAYFESQGAAYTARVPGGSIAVTRGAFRLAPHDGAPPVTLQWVEAGAATLGGESPTGGVSHYLTDADPSRWRRSVPHFSRVRARGIYRGVDAIFYARGSLVEFDLEVAPGGELQRVALEISGHEAASLAADGALVIRTGGHDIRLRKPVASQSGEPVACNFRLSGGRVYFDAPGRRSDEALLIDPVVEFSTMIGGDALDRIQSVAVDGAGNPVVAGVTLSRRIAGGAERTPGTAALFVTKLTASGSVLFTTYLGNWRPSSEILLTVSDLFSVYGLDADAAGNVYVAGQSPPRTDFPVTPDAWSKDAAAGFAVKLDASGNLIYSTFLGPPAWSLRPYYVRVLDGHAYIAGMVDRPEFLGTPGAFQRGVSGGTDAFLLKLNASGSAQVFVTAFGGAQYEYPKGIAVSPDGSVTMTGVSGSPVLPLTADALSFRPAPGELSTFYARFAADGSRLLYSTWLGAPSVTNPVVTPGGDIAIAAERAAPAEFAGDASVHTIRMTADTTPVSVMRMGASSNRPVSMTELHLVRNGRAETIGADEEGNLTLDLGVPLRSGGAYDGLTRTGIVTLAADGATLLYSSGTPVSGTVRLAGSAGAVMYAAGYAERATLDRDDGVLMRLNLAGVRGGNVFLAARSMALTWRIGEPLPAPVSIPVYFTGDVNAVTVESSSPAISASFEPGEPPLVKVNVDPNAASVGKASHTVTVRPVGKADITAAAPVLLEVRPAVVLEVTQSEVEFRYRFGEERQPVRVDLQTDFGGEYFEIRTETSAPEWLYASASRVDNRRSVLDVSVGGRPVGVYEGVVTLRVAGIQSILRTVRVRYIVTPSAVLRVSPAALTLKMTAGQPVTPGILSVTSDVPGAKFEMFVGTYRTWMKFSQSGGRTPGTITVSAESAAASPGIFDITIFVSSEGDQRIAVPVRFEVTSSAVLETLPAHVNLSWQRGGPYLRPLIALDVLTRTPMEVRCTVDAAWISPREITIQAPAKLALGLVNTDTMPEGVHNATITFTAGPVTVRTPVTFELYDIPRLLIAKDPLTFRYQMGGPPPPAQEIRITNATAKPGYFSVGRWGPVKVEPGYGAAPATVQVTVLTDGLTPGTHTGSVSVQSQYPTAPSIDSFPVQIEVLPDPNGPSAALARVTNAASYLPGAVSPGEIVVLFGSGIGPETLAVAGLGGDGKFPGAFGGIKVFFDDTPAPVLYASAAQTAVVAPFGIAGRSSTRVSVEANGRRSEAQVVSVAAANPGVFTADSSGSGAAATIPEGPFAPGDVVAIFATGLGTTTPSLVDGAPTGLPLPALNGRIRVLVGGRNAEVLYAGPAPLLVAGLMQINFCIPADMPAGLATVLVMSGDEPSQPGVTVRVQ